MCLVYLYIKAYRRVQLLANIDIFLADHVSQGERLHTAFLHTIEFVFFIEWVDVITKQYDHKSS